MPTTRSGRESNSAKSTSEEAALAAAVMAPPVLSEKRTRGKRKASKTCEDDASSTTVTHSRLLSSTSEPDASSHKKPRSTTAPPSILHHESSSESSHREANSRTTSHREVKSTTKTAKQARNRSDASTTHPTVVTTVTPATTTAPPLSSGTNKESKSEEKALLPDGVIPIFDVDGCTTLMAVAASISKPHATHHSTSKGNSDHTPHHPLLLFATPTPTQSRSRATITMLSDHTPRRPWRRCSLVHSHLTTYGADYWRELVVREKKEASMATTLTADDGSTAISTTWEDDTTASVATEKENNPGHGNTSTSTPELECLNPVVYTSDDEDDTDLREQVDAEEQSSDRLPHQPLLSLKMRRVLVLWMSEVAQEYKLSEAAYHLAVTLLDTVVTRGPAIPASHVGTILSGEDDASVDSSKWFLPRDFQALGCACMWIASKMEDKTPPLAEQLVYISNYCFTADKLGELETRICKELDFHLHRVTPFHFVALYIRASRAQPVQSSVSNRQLMYSVIDDEDDGKPNMLTSMTLYLLELSRSSHFLSYQPPSLLAAAAVYLARATLGIRTPETTTLCPVGQRRPWTGVFWSRTLAYYSGYETHEMVDTIRHLHALHRAAERRPNETPPPSFVKYQSASHHRVSLKTVRRVEDLGLVRFRPKETSE